MKPGRVALTLVLCLLPLAVARASDGPPFGAEDVAIEEEGLAPGWTLTWDELEGLDADALEAWVVEVARGAGLAEDALTFADRRLAHEGGGGALLLLVEVDGDAKGLEAALRAHAGAGSRAVRALGDPARIAVVEAPEAQRPAVMAMEVAYAVRTLTRLAWERLEAGSRLAALDLAKAAQRIDGAAGMPWAVAGIAAVGAGDGDEAIAAFRRAFSPDATLPPEGAVAVRGYAAWGTLLLQKKDAGLEREARDLLKRAVEREADATNKSEAATNRYNLACAYARAGDTQDALQELARALARLKETMDPQAFHGFLEHARKDEDFASIRDDPAFAAVLERAAGGGGGSTSGM